VNIKLIQDKASPNIITGFMTKFLDPPEPSIIINSRSVLIRVYVKKIDKQKIIGRRNGITDGKEKIINLIK
tara:strand:+ start:109 stop:321 length:213 start_codon:yes stop_codon:yes gene_type:complete